MDGIFPKNRGLNRLFLLEADYLYDAKGSRLRVLQASLVYRLCACTPMHMYASYIPHIFVARSVRPETTYTCANIGIPSCTRRGKWIHAFVWRQSRRKTRLGTPRDVTRDETAATRQGSLILRWSFLRILKILSCRRQRHESSGNFSRGDFIARGAASLTSIDISGFVYLPFSSEFYEVLFIRYTGRKNDIATGTLATRDPNCPRDREV